MGKGGKAVGITVEANATSRIRSHALGAPVAAIRVMNQVTIRSRDRVGAEVRYSETPNDQRERTTERLRLARALIGSTDAPARFNA